MRLEAVAATAYLRRQRIAKVGGASRFRPTGENLTEPVSASPG